MSFFTHKKRPREASIHEIKELFPLKPSLKLILFESSHPFKGIKNFKSRPHLKEVTIPNIHHLTPSKWHDKDTSLMKRFHPWTLLERLYTKHIVLWKFLVHCCRMSWCWIYNTAGILLVSNINIERSHHAKLVLYEWHSETTFTNINWKAQDFYNIKNESTNVTSKRSSKNLSK